MSYDFDKTFEYQHGKCQEMQSGERLRQSLIVARPSSEARHPTDRARGRRERRGNNTNPFSPPASLMTCKRMPRVAARFRSSKSSRKRLPPIHHHCHRWDMIFGSCAEFITTKSSSQALESGNIPESLPITYLQASVCVL